MRARGRHPRRSDRSAGGAGAVGHASIQLARWAGARVIATVSSDEKAAARAAGADHVVNYRSGDAAEEIRGIAREGVDVVVEVAPATNAALDEAVLAPGGTAAVYATDDGEALELSIGELMDRNARYQFVLVYTVSEAAKDQAIADVTAAAGGSVARRGRRRTAASATASRSRKLRRRTQPSKAALSAASSSTLAVASSRGRSQTRPRRGHRQPAPADGAALLAAVVTRALIPSTSATSRTPRSSRPCGARSSSGSTSDGEFLPLDVPEPLRRGGRGCDRPKRRRVPKRVRGDARAVGPLDRGAPAASRQPGGAREAAFLAGITDHLFKVAFPAASIFVHPSGSRRTRTEFYDEFVEHAIEIERGLIADTVAAGCRYVQLDFPLYPYLVDPSWSARFEEAGHSVAGLLEKALAADRAVLEGLPDEVTGLHLPRELPVPLALRGLPEPVAEQLFGALTTSSSSSGTTSAGTAPASRFASSPRVASWSWASSARSGRSWRPRTTCCGGSMRHRGTRRRDRLALSTACGFASVIAGTRSTRKPSGESSSSSRGVADRVWPS